MRTPDSSTAPYLRARNARVRRFETLPEGRSKQHECHLCTGRLRQCCVVGCDTRFFKASCAETASSPCACMELPISTRRSVRLEQILSLHLRSQSTVIG